MDQEIRFIADYRRPFFSLSELCARFGVSREAAYKWIERFESGGPSGLEERLRRPHACPRQTPSGVVEALLEFRRRHPTWGARNLIRILSQRKPDWNRPARSTTADILRRNSLVTGRKRRSFPVHARRRMTPKDSRNSIWTKDFKGQFRTRDGEYVYPLTTVDGYNRYLLACQGLRSTAIKLAKPVFERLFEEFGLPGIIRSRATTWG